MSHLLESAGTVRRDGAGSEKEHNSRRWRNGWRGKGERVPASPVERARVREECKWEREMHVIVPCTPIPQVLARALAPLPPPSLVLGRPEHADVRERAEAAVEVQAVS